MESNDLIRRSDLNDKLDELCVNDAIHDSLQAIPTVDAIPVVRCGECKNYKPAKYAKNAGTCHKRAGVCRDYDFCSYGERKCDET